MKKIDLMAKPAVLNTVDTFMASVPWTKNRTVIVYLREHTGRRYIRLRTFNRHQIKGCWYPSPRFFTVPIEHAERLGNSIAEAAKGKPFGSEPDWWAEFEEQYITLTQKQRERRAKEAKDELGDSIT